MDEPMRRRTALAVIGAGTVGLAGCTFPTTETDGNGDGDDLDGNDTGNDTDGNETDSDDGATDGSVGASQQAIERSTIDHGEVIGDYESWSGSGGSYLNIDPNEALTNGEALRIEQMGVTHATAGYDFPEPISLDGRHLSTAIKVESPTGGQLVARMHAPSGGSQFVFGRRLPTGMSDWFRVDLGITRGDDFPDIDDVHGIRFHVSASEETEVKFWLDDVRLTEGAGESHAILAFLGGRSHQYENAFPLLEERGIPAAVAVNPMAIGSDGYMTLDQLRELRSAGWDICSYPSGRGALPDLDADDQRAVIEQASYRLRELGFEDGVRHFFAPQNRVDGTTIDIVREVHETGFHYGGNSAGMPPTAPHTLPLINGGDYDGSRSVILRADRHEQLVTLAFDRIGDRGMSEESFGEQLDRLESNDYADGLSIITPSTLVDDHL